METQPLQNITNYEIIGVEEDPFLFSGQLHPLDFSEYSSLNCQWEMPNTQEQGISLFETLPMIESFSNTMTDPFYSPLDILPIQNISQGDSYSLSGTEFGDFDELGVAFEAEKQMVLYNNGDHVIGDLEELMKEKKVNRSREGNSFGGGGSNYKELSRETLSQYFYMPITQAAKELNVGLTLLKKRCRELGIPRWPHRKLMSLQTLIKNVQEMEVEDGEESETKIRDAVELLEQQRKLMEEMPEIALEEKTKKLRQACFKANYKKRKLVGMLEWEPNSSISSPLATST